MWRANVDDACMFAWRSTRSESQRHYSQVGVSSERREPNGVGRSRLAGCELRGRRVQQEECRSVRAVQCSAGRRGKKVRSGASQVIVRVGKAVPWWCMVQASEMSRVAVCLSVCLRLKLTSGRAWEERDKHGGTFDHFPRTEAAQSRAWANPHIVPAHKLTAIRLVHMHGHLTSCRSAQASVMLSGLSTCVHMPRYGPCSRHSGARAVSP